MTCGSTIIEREARDGVCTLRMCHGKANALDVEQTIRART
jgi:hypothetical protein